MLRVSPRFFCLEGIDGSGKTTQMELLEAALTERGHACVRLREPGGSKISEQIRALLLNPEFKGVMDDKTELLLYSAARAQVIRELIAPALDAGKVVLADRFVWSTFAYQGFGRGLDAQMIMELSEITCGNYFPELTLVLDVSVEECAARMKKGERVPDRLESEKSVFFERVRAGYRQAAADYSENVVLIDACKTPEEMHRDILERVLARI
ncbi:MAG: dTMP kinase [Fibrobacter sp.]|jgi:dTMP kinase|nr:dTMP kinase [Fibrobacter sp.]